MLLLQVLRSNLAILFRIVAIVSLAFLILSLILPGMGVFGFMASAFDSPNTSPPDTSPPGPPHPPPGQSHSPPGPFKSPPGPFKSPLPPYPGGKGVGLGPVRHIDLSFFPYSMVNAPDASGEITISGKYPDDHPKWADFPQSIDYAVSKLPCQDFVNDNIPGYSGRYSYALYLITETGERYRLQSFNPGCPNTSYKSWVLLPYIPEEILLSEDVVFEVHVERDDGWDSPDYYYGPSLVLRGEDIGE
jgi:hypothetical protein